MVIIGVVVEVAEGSKEGALLGLGLLEVHLLEVVVGVIVKAAEGSKEGVLLGLGLLEVHLLECLLVEASLRLVLAKGVLALVLVPADVELAEGVLVLLGAVGDEVVGISIAIASLLRSTTVLALQAVVVKPRELADDERQLIIPEDLQLLLCD